jgi:hypothetical protein
MVETQTSSPREAASHVKDQVAEQGTQLKDTATQHAGAVAEEAKAKARSVVDDTREEVGKQLDEQGRRLGETVRTTSDQLRSMADRADPGMVADVTRQIGDKLSSVADTMQRDGVQGVADDLRSFARRQPAVFLAGAGIAGFFVARLLRSGAASASTVATPPRQTGPTAPDRFGSATDARPELGTSLTDPAMPTPLPTGAGAPDLSGQDTP